MEKYPSGRRAVVSALADARKAARLSQRQLSGKLGAVNNYCQQVEALEQGIDAEEVIPWAEACGTTAVRIFKAVERLMKTQRSETATRSLALAKTAKTVRSAAKTARSTAPAKRSTRKKSRAKRARLPK